MYYSTPSTLIESIQVTVLCNYCKAVFFSDFEKLSEGRSDLLDHVGRGGGPAVALKRLAVALSGKSAGSECCNC